MNWLTLSVVVVFLDQVTKYFARTGLEYAVPVPVMPSFNLTLLHNYGAAFSFLSNQSGWQRWFFMAVAFLAVIFMTLWLRKIAGRPRTLAMALALVIGGAAGNLIDRVWLGYVVDFVQLYYSNFYWPAFNIADSAITVGAVLLVWDALRNRPEAGENAG